MPMSSRVICCAALTLAAAASSAQDPPGTFARETCDQKGCTQSIVTDLGPEQTPDAIRADRAENGRFDLSATTGQLRGWEPYSLYSGTGTAVWDPADAAGDANSGSLVITTTGGNPDPSPTAQSHFGRSQCVRPGDLVVTSPATCYTLGANVTIPPGQVPGIEYWEGLLWFGGSFYASTDCSGVAIFSASYGVRFTPQGTSNWYWTGLGGPCNNAANARSVRYYIKVAKQNNVPNPLTAYVDNVQLTGIFKPVKGDIDSDGETDLLLHNNVTGENVAWSMRDEVRQGGAITITPTPSSLDWQIAGTDDFNADGQNDLLQWSSASGAAEIWLMNGTSRTGSPVPVAGALPLPWKPSATADFNLDGSPDIVWRNYGTQKISIWTMNGTGQMGTITPKPDQAVDANWEIVGAPDINGDTQTDLLWYNWDSGKIVYWAMKYSADSTECSSQSLSTPCYYRIAGAFTTPANAGDANWKVLATGDYGIGPSLSGTAVADTTDLVWRNATSGRMVVWFMDKTGSRTGGVFITPDPPAPATDWTVAGPR